MKKFIFFFRGGTGNEEWSSWIEELKQKGAFISGAPLVQDGKITEQNGKKIRNFVFDINENARGFVIIKAKDFEEAASLSQNCPVFENGGNITIRPIKEEF